MTKVITFHASVGWDVILVVGLFALAIVALAIRERIQSAREAREARERADEEIRLMTMQTHEFLRESRREARRFSQETRKFLLSMERKWEENWTKWRAEWVRYFKLWRRDARETRKLLRNIEQQNRDNAVLIRMLRERMDEERGRGKRPPGPDVSPA